ncbi:hypothetical protein [Brenneria tiliae]|uniref:SH3 domain-containing protein n=1 Tax=Brenneria tiliae TaxID=2914984 RepID=A0ABT0MNY6_9GAMM|nr:hypothetical protein [Brenneria tiliae]MCL2891545.1 hypothetical protein [Brenneria tiliae]
MKRLMITSAAMLALYCTNALAKPLLSGVYENLFLAVSPLGAITGYYHEEMGEGTTRSCEFALTGQASKDGYSEIISWSDAIRPGTLKTSQDGITLTVPQGQQHAGCINVMMPQIDSGLDLEKNFDTHWIQLVQITDNKAILHIDPKETANPHGYVVKNDVVGIITQQSGWSLVEYISDERKSTRGWIEDKQFKTLTPP